MAKKPEISIIMPVYKDCYKTLGRAVYSLQDQDLKSWELVIVFDGIEENKKGVKALKEGFKLESRGKKHTVYPLKDKRVKFWVKEWEGTCAARNFGFSVSKGKYITLIDPDVYLYPGTLREWRDALVDNPEYDFVYGHYDFVGGHKMPSREFSRKYLETSNYITGAGLMRREVYPMQEKGLKSLQDWDMWLSVTEKGSKGFFIDKSFFVTEKPGKTSEYSHAHWEKLTTYLRNKHGIPKSLICISSLGADFHAINTAEILGADVNTMPSYKPHSYKMIYLMGFYPSDFRGHLAVFAKDFVAFMSGKDDSFAKCKRVIHWIGTDVLQMRTLVSHDAMKGILGMFKKLKIIHLSECEHIRKELEDLGIKSRIVPTLPSKLFKHNEFPQPKKYTVANYINPTQREIYAEGLMTEIAHAMPDVNFIFYGDKTKAGYKDKNIDYCGWKPIEEIIKRSSILVRIVQHDGLPHAPLQFLSAGRRVISNIGLPYFDKVKGEKKAIIDKIRKIRNKPEAPKRAGNYWKKILDPDKYREEIWGMI